MKWNFYSGWDPEFTKGDNHFDHAQVLNDLVRVGQLEPQRWQVPIYIGEFSPMHDLPNDLAGRKRIMTEFNRLGWHYSPWTWKYVNDDGESSIWGVYQFNRKWERTPNMYRDSKASILNVISKLGPDNFSLHKPYAKILRAVLADINLPGMNGIECVRQLKERWPQTPFLMLTVYEDAEKIFSGLAAGAPGYLLKRTCEPELLAAIADLRSGGSPMTSAIARKVVQSFRRLKPQRPTETEGQLSPREKEILELLARGYLYKEIAQQLKISVPTVNAHIRNMNEKLRVHSRSQAVARFIRV